MQMKGRSAIFKILGTDTLRGVATTNVVTPGDGYVYTTLQWTPDGDSAARGVSEIMNRSLLQDENQ